MMLVMVVWACEGGPKIHHSVGKLLEPLASKIDRTGLLQTLYLVHRLDKETTGVMVLAKCVAFTAQCRHYKDVHIQCLTCTSDLPEVCKIKNDVLL